MTIVVRPPVGAEIVDYLRALPYANGLPSWEPWPAAWHGGAEAWPKPGPPRGLEQLRRSAAELAVDPGIRPQAAFDGDRIVGASATLALEVTVPGMIAVPFAGVTATGVIATHRRRGALRAMMRAMFDDAVARGEALAMLSASEGSIYGRYGYGPATTRTRWEIDRADAGLIPAEPDTGTLELVDAAVAREVWPGIHDAVRATRVGEISATPGRWDGLDDDAHGDDGPNRYLVHRDGGGTVDGIATFTLPWSRDPDGVGTLVVQGLEATPAAARSLWSLLLDFDLTRRVVAAGRPVDEPLRWMLRNPRALRVTRQTDNMWLRILDLPAALAARRYEVPGSVTFEVTEDRQCPANTGTWRLEAGVDGEARCRRVETGAQLRLGIESLGSLYLGGMSAHTLAAAGRILGDRAAIGRLSQLLRTDPAPFNAIGF